MFEVGGHIQNRLCSGSATEQLNFMFKLRLPFHGEYTQIILKFSLSLNITNRLPGP
jgi:hypothetical protein